jgi:hypothetical protein
MITYKYSLLMLFCLTTTLLQSCDGMLVIILVKGPDCIGLLRLHLNVEVFFKLDDSRVKLGHSICTRFAALSYYK